MAALKNAKHEAFAQGLAKGLSADEAYARAGFKPNRGNASRLKANESIAARVDEIVGKGAERAEATVERVLKELSRIGFSDLRNVFTEGGHLRHPSTWDDATAAAISSIKVITRPAGGVDEDGNKEVEHVHEIKLWDKNSALEKIAKHLGMFVDRVDHTSSDGSMTPKPTTIRIIGPDDGSDDTAAAEAASGVHAGKR